jgi:hypothetical protein
MRENTLTSEGENMDSFKRETIENRARAIGRACEYILNYQNESDEIAGVGFRWAYLILRKPKRYLDTFHSGDLRIDQTMLEECFWLHQETLPGTCAILPEEIEILRLHNNESVKWMQENQNVISLTKRDNNSYK